MNKLETETLALLKQDSRMSAEKIAKAVGASAAEIKDVIAQLEDSAASILSRSSRSCFSRVMRCSMVLHP